MLYKENRALSRANGAIPRPCAPKRQKKRSTPWGRPLGKHVSRSGLFRISCASRRIKPAGGHILGAGHAAHHAPHQAAGAEQPQRHRRSYAETQCAHTAHRHHFAMSFIHGEKTPFTMKTATTRPTVEKQEEKRPDENVRPFFITRRQAPKIKICTLTSCLSWQPCAGCSPWPRQERSRRLQARQSAPWRS